MNEKNTIDVTPSMIEAGISRLMTVDLASFNEDELPRIIKEIFLAMMRA